MYLIGHEFLPSSAGPVRATICRDPNDGVWIGIAALPAGSMGHLTIQEIVHERPIRDEVYAGIAKALSRSPRYGGSGGYEVSGWYDLGADPDPRHWGYGGDYEYGFGIPNPIKLAGKTLANTKLAAKAIVNARARKKLLKKIENGIEKTAKVAHKVYTSPAFAGVIGVTAAITAPFGGAALGVAYAISRAAMKLAEGIAKGDPKALADAALIAGAAASGNPEAQAVLAEVQKASASLGVTNAEGPALLNATMASGAKSL